jgi:hypothetical protein
MISPVELPKALK